MAGSTGGPTVVLSNAHDAQPTFVAPEGLADTTVTFELTVTDGTSTSVDTVVITVERDNDAPSADAGPDLFVEEGDSVMLVASGSDPETAVQFSWRQISGTPVVLDALDTATPWFTAPEGLVNSDLVFEVTAPTVSPRRTIVGRRLRPDAAEISSSRRRIVYRIRVAEPEVVDIQPIVRIQLVFVVRSNDQPLLADSGSGSEMEGVSSHIRVAVDDHERPGKIPLCVEDNRGPVIRAHAIQDERGSRQNRRPSALDGRRRP